MFELSIVYASSIASLISLKLSGLSFPAIFLSPPIGRLLNEFKFDFAFGFFEYHYLRA